MIYTYLTTMLIGLLGGFASGLFGVGGGVLFVPLLILWRRLDPHLAIGTSLAVIIPTALAGVLKYQASGMIDWKTVGWIFLFAMIGAWLGAQASLKFETIFLRRFFALFLIFLAFKMFFQK